MGRALVDSLKTILRTLGFWLITTATVSFAASNEQTSERFLQLILVPTQSKAAEILESMKAGESFEDLAKEYSIDPTAANGGHLGKMKLSDMRKELRQALEGVGSGEVTDVFRTPAGYMILKVLPEPPQEVVVAQEREQFVAYVSGFEESLYFFSQLPKPPDYHQDLKVICETKRNAVRGAIQRLHARLDKGLPPRQLMEAHHTLAQLWSYEGDMTKAIEHFQRAYDIATAHGIEDFQLALREKLGIAYMRKGEMENCIQNHNARSCIFPLSPEARHKLESGSKNAVSLFLEYLEEKPDDLEVRWLLNVASMTLGKHPGDVPADYLIPRAAFESAEDRGEFVDVAPSLGLNHMNTAGGTVMDDMDNDGFLDIVISIVNVCESMRYYHNNGNGTFSDWTERAKLNEQLGGINLNQVDYNNDGWLDLFVIRGGWEFPMRNSLLRNNRNGTFSDVTQESGLASPAYPSPTAAWADFDNDGNVDLFVGNENGPGQLFRNKGDGKFVNVASAAGVDRVAFTKGAVWGDYDNDGFPDLYVSNFEQANFLYHNNGDGTFTNVARQLKVEKPIFSFPVWFFDYNNDGWLDLFVSSYVQSVAAISAEYLDLPTSAETIKLYRNTGKGSFEDVTKVVGLDRISMAMGANFGDFDSDGFLDFYLGTGSPSYGSLVPNLLFRNKAGEHFVDITSSSGTGHLQKGHGITFGDIDHDGDQDIFLHVGGAIPGDVYGNVLFENPGHDNNWIGVRLIGEKSNRAAVGARIKVTVEAEGGNQRVIYRELNSGGSFGSSSFLQHIGLGRTKQIETLEIWWPTSRTRQEFHDISPDQCIEVIESGKSYRKLDKRSFALPGGGTMRHRD